MLVPRHLRDLSVNPRQHPRGKTFLSAASGLARVKGQLYVVADDEHHLGRFEEAGQPSAPVQLLRLIDGDLPQDMPGRKAVKPDLEALAVLPALPGYTHGALLALGSGSRSARETGVLVALDAQGIATQLMAQVDLSELYATLRVEFASLNIEGAFVDGARLHLLQRGNLGDQRNAWISFDWNQAALWLAGGRAAAPVATSVRLVDLGAVDGQPLGLTDAAALPGGAWAFSAVAENTHDSYQDGACTASAVGVIGPDAKLRQVYMLQGAPKVEGIAVRVDRNALVFSLVTDADNPGIASRLLQVHTPLGELSS